MDITLARTFLEVAAAGNFGAAAERLHVTQSAVSMRIRSLEAQLGRPLFLRGRGGASLTPAGQQFVRYAASLVRVWEEARHQVAIPPGFRDALVVGGQYSLWPGLLMRWLHLLEQQAPDLALRAEVGMPDRLIRHMSEGVLDIAVMYTPQLRPGLKVERLFDERLVLVSADPALGADLGPGYVFVDWGPEFHDDHALNFPDYTNPGLTLALGTLGLAYVLAHGRAGYFPQRLVAPYVARGELRLVEAAPPFEIEAYAVFRAGDDAGLVEPALATLRQAVAEAGLPAPDALPAG